MHILQSIIYSSAAILPNRLLYALAQSHFSQDALPSFCLCRSQVGIAFSAMSRAPYGGKAHKDYCPTVEHLMKFQDLEAPANFPEMAIQEAKIGGHISPAGKGKP